MATASATTRDNTHGLRAFAWRYCGAPAQHCTFHNWYSVRRLILRCFGADLASTVKVRPSTKIHCPWNLTIGEHSTVGDHAILDCAAAITIGNRCAISQYAHLHTSNSDPSHDPGPQPITFGDDCWIAGDVYVAPGVAIGNETVVGSRSSVFDTLPDKSICVGDRAARIGERTWKQDIVDMHAHSQPQHHLQGTL